MWIDWCSEDFTPNLPGLHQNPPVNLFHWEFLLNALCQALKDDPNQVLINLFFNRWRSVTLRCLTNSWGEWRLAVSQEHLFGRKRVWKPWCHTFNPSLHPNHQIGCGTMKNKDSPLMHTKARCTTKSPVSVTLSKFCHCRKTSLTCSYHVWMTIVKPFFWEQRSKQPNHSTSPKST